jgi:hypothetical protein
VKVKMPDQKRFLNQDLVLQVSKNIDPAVFDIDKYEGVIDALCGERNYQKEAIRTTLRYMLGGQYKNLMELAEENFNSNEKLRDLYGSFIEMKNIFSFQINSLALLTMQLVQEKAMLSMESPVLC